MSWEDILKESEEERKKREHRERSLAGQGQWGKKKRTTMTINADHEQRMREAGKGKGGGFTDDADDEIDFKELNKEVWLSMLDLKKLIGQRRLPPQVERMMEVNWMELSQKLEAATTKPEWEQGVKALKSFMNTVLNNDFRTERSADDWLKRRGFII